MNAADFAPLLYALGVFALVSIVAGCFCVATINVGRRREYLRGSLPKKKPKLRGTARRNYHIAKDTLKFQLVRKEKKCPTQPDAP